MAVRATTHSFRRRLNGPYIPSVRSQMKERGGLDRLRARSGAQPRELSPRACKHERDKPFLLKVPVRCQDERKAMFAHDGHGETVCRL